LKAGWLDGTLTKSGQQLELRSNVILKGHTLEQPLKYTIPFQISKCVTEQSEGDSTILIIHHAHAACNTKTSRMGRDSRGFLQTRDVESCSIMQMIIERYITWSTRYSIKYRCT